MPTEHRVGRTSVDPTITNVHDWLQQLLEDLCRNGAYQMIDDQTIRTNEHLDAALAHDLTHRVGMQQSARNRP